MVVESAGMNKTPRRSASNETLAVLRRDRYAGAPYLSGAAPGMQYPPHASRNGPTMKPLQAAARTRGEPGSTGVIRRRPGDFRVEELLGFEASGDGEHVLLHVEKTGLNTADVAAALAAHAGAATRDAGYSGLKDRNAVCNQWFTVPWSSSVDWGAFARDGIRVLAHGRHHRKLKRGAHRANRFRITVTLDRVDAADLEARLAAVRAGGVPNYFGEQRFGRRFESNARRLLDGGRLQRLQRSMTLSGIRADLFNRILDRRVRDGTWRTALPGEYLNLDGTRSGFAAADGDPDIARRVAEMDLHPTGALYGRGANPAAGEAAAVEASVLDGLRPWCEVLAGAGLKFERRPTRCVVRELDWSLDAGRGLLELGFVLRRGEFATGVLRELVDYRDVTRHPEEAE